MIPKAMQRPAGRGARAALWLLLGVCPCVASAQQPPKGIRLQQALEAAAQGPELTATRAWTHAGELEASAVGGFPATEVGVGTTLRTPRAVIVASVPLPVFGTLGAERRAGHSEVAVLQAQEAAQWLDQRRRAHRAWVQLALAEAAVDIATDAVERARRIADASSKRFEAGDASQVEVLTAQAAMEAAQAELGTAEQTAVAASIELAAVLGWPPEQRLHAEGGLPNPDPASAPQHANASQSTHPSLRVADAKVAAGAAQITVAERHRWPGLALQVEAGIDDPTLPGSDLRVALLAQLPLGSRLGEAVDAARARRSAASAERDAASMSLHAERQGAEQQLAAAVTRFTILRDRVLPLQQKVAELAAAAYLEGQQGMVTVVEAERTLAEVRHGVVEAQARAALARADLDWALGGGS